MGKAWEFRITLLGRNGLTGTSETVRGHLRASEVVVQALRMLGRGQLSRIEIVREEGS